MAAADGLAKMMTITALVMFSLVPRAYGANDAPPDCSGMVEQACQEAKDYWAETQRRNAIEAARRKNRWLSRCSQDLVTREWSCVLQSSQLGAKGGISIGHSKATGLCFSGPHNDYPGAYAVIRLGDNEPIRYQETSVCGPVAQRIISQMRSEQPGAARGQLWPSGVVEYEFSTEGFNDAFAAFLARIKHPIDLPEWSAPEIPPP